MDEARREARRSYVVRKSTLSEQDDPTDRANTTAGERLGMMWQLTLDAWAFTGQPLAESRLSRHIVRVLRGER